MNKHFQNAEELREFLESLHETAADGSVTGRKWEPAQRAAAALALVAPANRDRIGHDGAGQQVYLVEDEGATLHQHLLDMLGAKDHEDAGRIIGELHATSTHPSRGVVDEAQRDRLVAVFRTMLKSSEPTTDADTDKDCTILPMPVEDFDRTMRIAIEAIQAAALPAVPERWVLVPREPTEAMHTAAVNAAVNDAKGAPWFPFAWRAALAATPAHDQPEGSDND